MQVFPVGGFTGQYTYEGFYAPPQELNYQDPESPYLPLETGVFVPQIQVLRTSEPEEIYGTSTIRRIHFGTPAVVTTGVPFILYAGRIDREPVEFWQQRFLQPGYFAPAVVPGTGVPRWLSTLIQEPGESVHLSRFLAKSRGEDLFLHRTLSAGLQRHEVFEEKFVQQLLRKGFGEDPLVPRLFGQHRVVELRAYDEGYGQFLSPGHFLFVAPSVPIVNFLFLNGIAYDAFVYDDYAVLFPSKFIHVGSDAVAPPVTEITLWKPIMARGGRGRLGR